MPFAQCIRSPNLLLKRDATKRKWMQMRETLRLARIKITFSSDSTKFFSPAERRRRGNQETSEGSSSPSPSSSLRATPNEWTFAFDTIINDVDGRALFTKFLQSEYSEENILFWWAAHELKTITNDRNQFEPTVQEMFETFIAADSPLAINIDHDTRMEIIDRVTHLAPADLPDNIFERAQAHVYRLMEKDCFSRFVHTQPYKDLAKRLNLPTTFRFNGRLSPI